MQTVPETERMEEFKAAPLPTLRLQITSEQDGDIEESNPQHSYRPPSATRKAAEPASPSPQSPTLSSPTIPTYTRNTSPYSRGHLRSRSTASALAPPMTRASSMPGVNAAGHLSLSPHRPASPRGSPNRNRALRKPADEVFPGPSSISLGTFSRTRPAIPEDGEAAGLNTAVSEHDNYPNGIIPVYTFPRIRRPASPLRNLSVQNTTADGSTVTNLNGAFQPAYQSRGSDPLSNTYNFSGSYTSSSVPSTPTSIRSRSPSISSLETIPDTPGAEEAALEAERIAQLKAAADAADRDGDEACLDAKRNISLDGVGSRGRTLGIVYGSRDKRKRWSVCGAERRGDLDLETIWED